MKKKPAKPKRGRPASGLAVDGRLRPILPRTSVAPETLAGIRAEGRPAGRVIDDAWQCYVAIRDGTDTLIIARTLRGEAEKS